MMERYVRFILIMAFVVPQLINAQTQHFSWTKNTGNNATVGVLLSTEITVNGENIQPGDEIGVFTPEGLCVGGLVWSGESNQALTAWGNNMMTDEKDGLNVGDTMYYRIWRQQDNTEHEVVIWEYESGSYEYEVNGVYVLSSLIAIPEPEAPSLQSPEDNADGLDPEVTFEWSASSWADSYVFQVASDNSFGTIVDEQELTATGTVVELDYSTTYYWRVLAVNLAGSSEWSAVRSFTTIVDLPATPVLVSPSNNAVDVGTSPELSWQNANGAETYTLQVSTVSDFSSTVVDVSSLEGTSYTVQELENETTYFWRVRAVNTGGDGNWSDVWGFTTEVGISTVDLTLDAGWNMISSNVHPGVTDIEVLFDDVDDPELFIKNASGVSYWPSYDIYDLTDWNIYEGYEVFVSAQHIFSIDGIKVDPASTPVELSEGWNIIPYFPDTPVPVTSALQSIEEHILVVKDIDGNVYWPEFEVNTLGDMLPGQGYQIYLSSNAELTYPAVTAKLAVSGDGVQSVTDDNIQPARYIPDHRNTGTNAVLLVRTPTLRNNDEVGVWTASGHLVGSGVVNNGRAVITVWGNNVATQDVIDGAVEDEELHLTVWSHTNGLEQELECQSIKNVLEPHRQDKTLTFKTDGLYVASVLRLGEEDHTSVPANYTLAQNYPNPFNPSTQIRFSIPGESHVRLTVYSLVGQKVALLMDETLSAGTYTIDFDATGLSSGVYFYRLDAGFYHETRRMVLAR